MIPNFFTEVLATALGTIVASLFINSLRKWLNSTYKDDGKN